MSIYGIMNTSVSGMNAQANKLSTVADNVANVNTVGYKGVATQFSSMVIGGSGSGHNSGSVRTSVTQSISQEGGYNFTTSGTDLAVTGSGFFIVNDSSGTPYLTRAGSFVIDANGDLVNTAGYYLQGYPIDINGNINSAANSTAGLETVNVANMEMQAVPSDTGLLNTGLPSGAAVGDTETTSIVTYDYLGNEVKVDFTYEKTGANQWSVTATSGSAGYNVALNPATAVMDFDPTTGAVTAGGAFDINIDNLTTGAPTQAITMDASGTKHLATDDFSVLGVDVNGNAPSSVEKIRIDQDGTLNAIFGNGDEIAIYKIPLGDVPSPDMLTAQSGNVYSVTNASGELRIGLPGDAGFGEMLSGALEGSNVDLATELTEMIQAQRTYSANSKVFTTSSEVLQELVNLR
ncbi:MULTISPECIES: flagellar hook protein FlgE [Pseudovibrio]|uniref:flagellar hook protein FlgE n=1 Tax=Stappiaceae TaxID=2821832 RepID=UPI002366830A|nr:MULTISPECIES: flagellar hook protein FlgE [Pseudovibrio]MDD7909003.1 flagellar hook protein FlgE [Pseudovibrio exalbescens]MDX5593676.1 flagellar hook protein FlgE [Pseudovibrio sp. SPO723]